jgi:2,3-bisphosphoglycerate-independent phosphoglycerate mutase
VTFFFSGGREEPYPGEDRILVPSAKVATYDLQPEMSAPEVTDKLVEAIRAQRYDAIICNYANGDMVGHTGIFPAAVKAVEILDACLARVIETIMATGSQCLITADHGNVEKMADEETGQAHTAHTSEPVPLVYVGPRPVRLRNGGLLSDIAPTMLHLMALPVPEEMTGRNLAELVEAPRRSV